MAFKDERYTVIFATREDAEDTLEKLKEIGKEYYLVRVADLYDLVGITAEYTDNKIGWSCNTVANASIVRVRDGWIINLPNPIPYFPGAKISYRDYSTCRTSVKPDPNPVYISIHTLEVEDLDDTLRSLFKSIAECPNLEYHIEIC